MSRKSSLVLFFVVLFGVFATTSAFAIQPPHNGVWVNENIASRFRHTHFGQVRLSRNIDGSWAIGLYDINRNRIEQITAPRGQDFGGRYTIEFRHRGQIWIIQHVTTGSVMVRRGDSAGDFFRQ